MIINRSFVTAGLFCILMTGQVTGVSATEVLSGDKIAIQALEHRLIEATRKKDVATIMSLYAPDKNVVIFDVVPPFQYLSKVNWKKNIEGFFASLDGPAGLEITALNITTSGDMAYSHMIQRFFGKTKGGGNLNLSTRVTDVYRKIRGHWFIVHEHVSVPVNLQTGRADLNATP